MPEPLAEPFPASPDQPLVLCGARLPDGRTADVTLRAGRVADVAEAGAPAVPPAVPVPAARRVDLAGYLLLPAPAEPHAHHDTALTDGAPRPALTGPHDPAGTRRRITEAALIQLAHGATAQRSHIRCDRGLAALDAALATARALRGLAELSFVATSGPGPLTGRAGAENRARLREAARRGARALGCCPDLDPDPDGCAEVLLGLAADQGLAADLHTAAADPVRLARLAAAASGLPPASPLLIGPAAGLARVPRRAAGRAAERLAAAGVGVVALPQGPCGLAGPAARGAATPVRLLASAGVRVTAGAGALRDAANPVGRGDPLEAAYLLAARGDRPPAEAYAAVSGRARRALGLPEVRVAPGYPAELLAVRGESIASALSQGVSRLVVHRGRIVARTSAVREFAGTPGPGVPGVPRQATG
ncbi:hydrolase [Streptomyces sp. DSM 44917]|uniref:Hydrolase n=1 Tax=Streptomyces boetiae TaxID=3075541 RepID=A0ABU2L8X7_9ACTN|nr:hydrolase [Streptomyces sp. DSM 44917]MDT0308028.1 hydrolase [Streptomyces sp. DSM 44917]